MISLLCFVFLCLLTRHSSEHQRRHFYLGDRFRTSSAEVSIFFPLLSVCESKPCIINYRRPWFLSEKPSNFSCSFWSAEIRNTMEVGVNLLLRWHRRWLTLTCLLNKDWMSTGIPHRWMQSLCFFLYFFLSLFRKCFKPTYHVKISSTYYRIKHLHEITAIDNRLLV